MANWENSYFSAVYDLRQKIEKLTIVYQNTNDIETWYELNDAENDLEDLHNEYIQDINF